MKEIKTVVQPIEYAHHFDTLVNCLLIDGWELKNRKVVTAPGELSEAFNASVVRLLYAELERHNPPYPQEITI